MPLPTLAEYFVKNKSLIAEMADAKLEKEFRLLVTDATNDRAPIKAKLALVKAITVLPLKKSQLKEALQLALRLEAVITPKVVIPEKKVPKADNEDSLYLEFTNALNLFNSTPSKSEIDKIEIAEATCPWLIKDLEKSKEKLSSYLGEITDDYKTLKPEKEEEIREKIRNYLALRAKEAATEKDLASLAPELEKPKTVVELLSKKIEQKLKEEESTKLFRTDDYDRVNFLIQSVASTLGELAPKEKLTLASFSKEDFTLASLDKEIAEKEQQLEDAKSDRREIVPDSILSLEKLAKALDENTHTIGVAIKNSLGWKQGKIFKEAPEYVAVKDLFGEPNGLTEENFSQFFEHKEDKRFEIVPAKAKELNPIKDEAAGINAEKLEKELTSLNEAISGAAKKTFGYRLWSNFLMTGGIMPRFEATKYPQIALALFPEGGIENKKFDEIKLKFEGLFSQNKERLSGNRNIVKQPALENLLSASKKSSLPTKEEINEQIILLNKIIKKAKPSFNKDWIKNIFPLPKRTFQSEYNSIAKILGFDVEADGWENKIKAEEFERRFDFFFEQNPQAERTVTIKAGKEEELLSRGYFEQQKDSEALQKLRKFLEHLNDADKGFTEKSPGVIVESLKSVEMPDEEIPPKYRDIIEEARKLLADDLGQFEDFFVVEKVKDGEKHKLKEEKRKVLVEKPSNQPSSSQTLSAEVLASLEAATTKVDASTPTPIEQFCVSLSKGVNASNLLLSEKFKALETLFPAKTSEAEKVKTLTSGKKLQNNLGKIWAADAKSLAEKEVDGPEAHVNNSKTAMTRFVIAMQNIEECKEKKLSAKYNLDVLKEVFASKQFLDLYKESLFYASLEGRNRLVTTSLTSDDVTLYKGFNKYYEFAARTLLSDGKLTDDEIAKSFGPLEKDLSEIKQSLVKPIDSAAGKNLARYVDAIVRKHRDAFSPKITEFYPEDYRAKSSQSELLDRDLDMINKENAILTKNCKAMEDTLSNYFRISSKNFQDFKGAFQGFLHLPLVGDSLPRDVLAIANKITEIDILNQGEESLLARILNLEREKSDAASRIALLAEQLNSLGSAPIDPRKTELLEASNLKLEAELRSEGEEFTRFKEKKEAEFFAVQKELKEAKLKLEGLQNLSNASEENGVFLKDDVGRARDEVSEVSHRVLTTAVQLVTVERSALYRSSQEQSAIIDESLLKELKREAEALKCDDEKEEFKNKIKFLTKLPRSNTLTGPLIESVIESVTSHMNLVADHIKAQLEKLTALDETLKQKASNHVLALKEITENFKGNINQFKEGCNGLQLVLDSIDMTYLLQKEIEKAEELTKEKMPAAVSIQESDIDHLSKKKLEDESLKEAEEDRIDTCLISAIASVQASSGNKIDLSKDTFKTPSQKQPAKDVGQILLNKKQIKRLASVDQERLSFSRYGGLTFDFKDADSEDVKKFLQSVYCADFRNCKIMNLNLEQVFKGKEEEEKNNILRNFSTVKFTNCRFQECKFEGFRFRVENINGTSLGLDPKTNILPPSTSPTKILEVKKAFGTISADLARRGAAPAA